MKKAEYEQRESRRQGSPLQVIKKVPCVNFMGVPEVRFQSWSSDLQV